MALSKLMHYSNRSYLLENLLLSFQNSLLYQFQKLFLLDKNHDNLHDYSLKSILNLVDQNTVNLVLYENSFTKIKFIDKIINSYTIPIFYVDFDLLFSGYYESGLIIKKSNITILRPNEVDFVKIISELLQKTATQQSIVILDSINGLHSILSQMKDSGRFVDSLIMFLTCNLKFSNSKLFLISLSEKKENQWVLSPIKRHILEIENMNKFQIEESDSKLNIQIL